VLALFAWPSVAELLGGLKDAALAGSGGAGAAAQIEASVIDPMAALWLRMDEWVTTAQTGLGFTDIHIWLGITFYAVLMFFAFVILCFLAGGMAVVSFAMFMIAQVIFELHLIVGPFFILCLIFPFTQRFFETYIGSAMTSIFALALTAIVLNIGGNILSLDVTFSSVTAPSGSGTLAPFIAFVKGVAILFLAKAGAAALLIYLFFKVFDLAAALGGGINMGNNLIGGVRSILSDLGNKGGKASGSPSNSMNSSGGATGGASSKAQAANAGGGGFTFTGAALRGGASAAGAVASGTLAVANAAARGAGSVGRFAYNRYSQNRNRISSS
jgi:type IV secretion system protein VirB6